MDRFGLGKRRAEGGVIQQQREMEQGRERRNRSWLTNREDYCLLIWTIIYWYTCDELDFTVFCSWEEVRVPRATLQRFVSNNKRTPQPFPLFQGNPDALSEYEYAVVLSSVVVGDVATNQNAIIDRLLQVCGDNAARDQPLSRADARRFVRTKLLPEAESILQSDFSPDFSRALFFQRTNTNNHGLGVSKPLTTKRNHAGHFSLYPSGVVVHETFVAVTTKGFYLAGNLRSTPHGDESVENLELTRTMAAQANVTLHAIPAGLQRAITPHVIVLREQTPELVHLTVALFPGRAFFDHVRANVAGTGGTRHEATTHSIDIAFAQPQQPSHLLDSSGAWYHLGRLMPHFKQPGADFCQGLPEDLRSRFVDLILYFEGLLETLCPDAFGDELRHQIFSPVMMQRTGFDRPVRFEYVTVIVKPETGNALNNHMDYMNDGRPGYTHSPVYWYLINDNGVTYRVTIVMTFRSFCGAAMEDIRRAMDA